MNCNIIYEKIKDLLPKDKIDALYLFGSYANGTYTEDSDIDLAIFGDDLKYIDIVDLEDKISNRLKKEVDLVLPEKNNAILLREIFQGKSLIETTEKFDEWFEKFNEWLISEWWFIEMCINERCGLGE
ncbi:nucleotidyltransferase domain-containing protein [Clostridium botulinum]|uniref:Nucleotidyltransferase domain-containing protein n=1 Tax=Clostridium botulinum TaxID=1491 RepID=A0A0M1M153_CLOBO|nr:MULTISPECIES: nucleotidyltransferase domain-containing protein [Clostridium]KAI3345066.1 nucleotidyltransferase domain-containing protein [Clostridium botulinum]KOM87684.1 nucleotidyltransferase [Clostridium botulinum]KOR63612.1 nucleotidyltransferase [Clostridium botulinum]MCS6112287.1 nucleotidyltransferase domain-containing protein [Clostridium botulinum]MCS6132661.1 nucleotidyltransferase domain-containing protein [Clostridium botulinum]